jgi:hypothetical protein
MSFFDEREEPARRAPTRRRPPGGPSTDPSTIRIRQFGLIGGAIVLLILLVFGFRACSNSRKDRAFKEYVRDVAAIIQVSDQESDNLFGLLRDPKQQSAVDVRNAVNGFRAESNGLVDRAKGTSHPGEFNDAHRWLVETLRFRAQGISAIADKLDAALGDKETGKAVESIAANMQLFLVSDVIYSQRAIPGLQNALKKEKLADQVQIPKSQFLPDIDWLRTRTVADRIARISGGGGGSAAPGLHGTGLGTVTVLPAGTVLNPGAPVDVPLSNDLAFKVQVTNQGENDEQDVAVKITLKPETGKAISLEDSIATIARGETKEITIPLADTPPTGQSVTVTVEVTPVPGERKTDNNKADFTVVFTK